MKVGKVYIPAWKDFYEISKYKTGDLLKEEDRKKLNHKSIKAIKVKDGFISQNIDGSLTFYAIRYKGNTWEVVTIELTGSDIEYLRYLL